MSKLFSLKKWITIDEIIQHLSNSFKEKISRSDVLRLVLDGHLTLSINFVNSVYAIVGKIVDTDNARHYMSN